MATFEKLVLFSIVYFVPGFIAHIVDAKSSTVHFGSILTNNGTITSALAFESFIELSFKQCVTECKLRQECDLINYLLRSHVCFLVSADAFDRVVVPSSTSVYSKKTDWDMLPFFCPTLTLPASPIVNGAKESNANWNAMNDVPEWCAGCGMEESCDQTQELCFTSGCGVPPPIDGAKILGNMYGVMNRIAYSCLFGDSLFLSVCQPNGQWSHVNPDCPVVTTPEITPSSPTGPYPVTSTTSLAISTTPGECMLDWYRLHSTCYRPVSAFTYWSLAVNYCQHFFGEGDKLVKITTQEEDVFIKDLLVASSSTGYWIALNFTLTNGWRWADGTDLQYDIYHGFDTSVPVLSYDACAYVDLQNAGTWRFTSDCGEGKDLVCERPLG